jgi:hypothetical protein
VVSTQQDEVVEFGFPVAGPMLNVMGVRSGWGPVTGGEHTSLIANGKGVAL